MRRGNYADFDPAKMVEGEFAVCLDNGYVYITLAPNNCIRLGTAETIEQAVEQAEEYVRECKDYYDKIVILDDDVEINVAKAKTSEDNAKESENKAKQYSDEMSKMIEDNIPNVYVDWTTGNLMYSGGSLSLFTDDNGYLHWGKDN